MSKKWLVCRCPFTMPFCAISHQRFFQTTLSAFTFFLTFWKVPPFMLFSREGEFPVSGRTQLNRSPIEVFPKDVTISFDLWFDEAPHRKFNILHLRSKHGPYVFDVESVNAADEDGFIAFSCFRIFLRSKSLCFDSFCIWHLRSHK